MPSEENRSGSKFTVCCASTSSKLLMASLEVFESREEILAQHGYRPKSIEIFLQFSINLIASVYSERWSRPFNGGLNFDVIITSQCYNYVINTSEAMTQWGDWTRYFERILEFDERSNVFQAFDEISRSAPRHNASHHHQWLLGCLCDVGDFCSTCSFYQKFINFFPNFITFFRRNSTKNFPILYKNVP